MAQTATGRAISGAAQRAKPTTPAGEGAGAMLALFAYPLLVNLLSGGPNRMWGWVKAKWINEPYTGGTS